MPGVLARKGHLSHAVSGKRRPCPGVFAVRLFMRPQQLAWQFLLILRRVKKSHSRPIEYVGTIIGRPYTSLSKNPIIKPRNTHPRLQKTKNISQKLASKGVSTPSLRAFSDSWQQI
ncbi:hypothetical protein [uncultured Gemmiger sp.]|uniref:hypothetical protein n=1 Tax=uncultured Gemmiger sp. TaxID=1623490 RepID=UPI0025D0A583|nr:hypothetical protein [uncultured Gemmiger sp.]